MQMLILILLGFCSTRAQQPSHPASIPLLQNSALHTLLTLENIPYEKTLDSIIEATQKAWCHKICPTHHGIRAERWNVSPELVAHYEALRPLYMPLFKELFLIDAVYAPVQCYRYIIVLGALGTVMQQRLETLKKEYQRGITADTIIVCCSERPLDRPQDTMLIPPNNTTIKTESDLFKWLIETQAPFLHDTPIFYIHTPMIMTSEGTIRRPDTNDTIIDWLTTYHPEPGTILAISNQPYCGYQKAVLETYLNPKGFTIAIAGDQASPNTKVVTLLDTLGRWLYFEQQKIQSDRAVNLHFDRDILR